MYGMTNCVRCRCGDDLSLVSADQFGSYIEIPGGNVRVPLGYVGVLAPLLRDLPTSSLKLVISFNEHYTGNIFITHNDQQAYCAILSLEFN